ncbi:MAG: hypothetical protein ACFFCM_05625 [Promethearchaeota archaeon]
MENRPSFVMGLLVLIIGIAAFFVPRIEIGYFGYLMHIGRVINVNVGILIMLGGIFNSKNLSGTGFGIGLAAWGLMILGAIMGTIKTLTLAADYSLQAILWVIVVSGEEPGWFFVFVIPAINTATSYQTGFILYLVHLGMGAGCLILGTMSFTNISE